MCGVEPPLTAAVWSTSSVNSQSICLLQALQMAWLGSTHSPTDLTALHCTAGSQIHSLEFCAISVQLRLPTSGSQSLTLLVANANTNHFCLFSSSAASSFLRRLAVQFFVLLLLILVLDPRTVCLICGPVGLPART